MGPRGRWVRKVGFACKEEDSEVGWVRDKRMCGRVRGTKDRKLCIVVALE